MKDLEQALSSKNTMSLCNLLTTYMLKHKCKQLVKFLIDQYARFYTDIHLSVVPFMVARIKQIQENGHSVSHRITRLSICELFVLLSQMPRHDDSSMLQKNHEPAPQEYRFLVKARGATVDCDTVVNHVMHFVHEPDQTMRYGVIALIKECVSCNSKGIASELSFLYASKAVVDHVALSSEVELRDVSLPKESSIAVFLHYILLLLCPPDRREICESFVDLSLMNLQKRHFNFLLRAYDVAFCPDIHVAYRFQNPYYTSIVLQCVAKIDYLYDNLSPDFPKVKLPKVHFQADIYQIKTDILFTFPQKQLRADTPKLCNDVDVVRTITIDQNKKKEKITYNIKKVRYDP